MDGTTPEIDDVPPVMLELREHEEHLAAEVEAYLARNSPEEVRMVRRRFDCLRKLGEAVSCFPTIRSSQMLRGELRDREKLLKTLCGFAPSSRLLHIPTRIVATRGYLVAKCHAFSLLAMLVKDREVLFVPLRRVIFSIICALMAEEVYFACLDDPAFPGDIKRQLADDLISLWESGTDPRSVQHLPALEALWLARDEAPPSFGTMDGSSEIIRISIDLGKDWQEFLMDQSSENETRWALEEFLFGLSYEEIRDVRSRLSQFGILAVGYDEVRSFLGSPPAYIGVRNSDPRDIYDFYIDRRDAANLRQRISAPGPRKTLEEMYLKFRLAQG
jgi:hypothetical protein